MSRAIICYIITFLKSSKLFYFICLLFIFLLYHQTFGLNIHLSDNIEIEGLWIDGGNGLLYYIKHIGLHYIFLSLFGIALLADVTSSFFSSDYIKFVFPKKPNRNKIAITYVFVMLRILLSFFTLHLFLLNVLLYLLL